MGATNLGRQLAPRVAARCRTGLTADCTVLEMKENTDLVQIRPAFGGNIMAQIVTPNTRPQFCTVRYKVFSEPVPTDAPSGEIVPMAVTEGVLMNFPDKSPNAKRYGNPEPKSIETVIKTVENYIKKAATDIVKSVD